MLFVRKRRNKNKKEEAGNTERRERLALVWRKTAKKPEKRGNSLNLFLT
jgi:hypothetical protein